ncbi:MAG: hypothetical protein R3E79_33255 [Caldilineaceae bacterium]
MHPDYTTTTPQHGLRLPPKVVGRLRRYLPAEVTGTVAALLVITLARHWDLNAVAIALIGVWGKSQAFTVRSLCKIGWLIGAGSCIKVYLFLWA